MNPGPVISAWFGVPIAAVLMLMVAAHALAMRDTDHPASRKRIRQANAVLILLTIPVLTAGFCLINPHTHAREWALIWGAAFAMLAFVVLLAIADMLNTVRLARDARRALRRELVSPEAGRFRDPASTRDSAGDARDDG